EITSDSFLGFMEEYVVGVGPNTDRIVPIKDNYLVTPTNLAPEAHFHDPQVTNFHQDLYAEYEYWINGIRVRRSVCPQIFQELSSPHKLIVA
ncbi:hypothetical protein MKW94_008414, partial [Papaver nudicaule]|nr:hypothetical protein [Papaver nudicaule]